MSYRLKVLSDMPLAYWRLEETSGTTAADSTGFGFNGTHFSTPTLNAPGLVSGSKAAGYTGTQHTTVNLPDLMIRGSEGESFAIEAWVKVESPPTARRMIAGRADTGIFITPGGVEFSALSTDGNTYTAYYTVTDWDLPFHIIANYVGNNLGLIVNAQEGTNADFEGLFVPTTTSFFLGGTSATSSTTIVLDEVAVYRRSLAIRAATSHYDLGLLAYHPSEVAQNKSGTYYAFDDSTAVVAFRYEEDEYDDFLTGVIDNVTLSEDYIVADAGAGTYTTDIQYIGDLGSIGGSRIDWDGSSAVSVDVSFDMGTTWTACVNHAEIPTLSPNYTVIHPFIMFRVNFASVAGYTPLLSRLSAVIYTSKSVSANVNSYVTVYGSPTLSEVAYGPLYNHSNMGINFVTGSYLTVPSPEGGAKSLDFWYRRNNDNPGGGWEYVIDTRTTSEPNGAWFAVDGFNAISTGGTSEFYINGQAKAPLISDFPIGRWVHVAMVMTTPNIEDVTVNSRFSQNESGKSSIAHFTLYPTALTAEQVRVRYQSVLGRVGYSVVDSATASITEVVNGTRAYTHAWSMVQTVVV